VKLAAIDIGTNSIHMLVVDTAGERAFEVVDREKTMVKLGAGLFGSRRMSERALAAGLDTLRRYVKLAESLGVDEILAVATSASREAENGGEFLHSIYRETGVDPRVISGTEEARLIFRAVRHAIDFGDERALVIDIGGGSVECIVGDKRQVLASESMRLGVLRLLDSFPAPGALTNKQVHQLEGYVRGVSGDFMRQVKKLGAGRVIGTSGTIRTLGEAAHLAAGNPAWRSANAQMVSVAALSELAKKLAGMDDKARAKLPGVSEPRADAIHLGAVLLVELLEAAGAKELTLCDASLREGVLLDWLDRHGGLLEARPHVTDVRRRSVIELARKYSRDDPHERHIASLALALFDQMRDLHALGDSDRDLLEHAALLHGIGSQLSFRGRHHHSRYIIRNSELRGFSDEEVELLGLIVRYHRGVRPKPKHPGFAELDERSQRRVRLLSGSLRIAVALDRGHTQAVKRVSCKRKNGSLEISIGGAGDLELELWSARRKTEPLARALGLELRVIAESELCSAAAEHGRDRVLQPPDPLCDGFGLHGEGRAEADAARAAGQHDHAVGEALSDDARAKLGAR
jgi:exopolyphosphatase / guanosine-5'-triphosphate,3'-diphosphate pyrophosphatase